MDFEFASPSCYPVVVIVSNQRVIAAMSGGVDSAVAAGLLKEAGYDVIGVTMKMYSPKKAPHARSCCGADDFDDARRTAAALEIPHYVLDFEDVFRRSVVERFAEDYTRGRTPNPCVACNNFVKLGTLRTYAKQLGARYIATGHYARVQHRSDGPHLFRGRRDKDQAYALAQLTVAQLEMLLLPLGHFDKQATRQHAQRLGLPVHDKIESQDICFVEGGDYRDIVAQLRPQAMQDGNIVTRDGEAIGRHSGITHFTIGQRRGLPSAQGAPRYVTQIDSRTNTIVIGRDDELLARELFADEVNLIRPERFGPGSPTPVRAMVRYRAEPASAKACVGADGTLQLTFDRPQRAISPGQLVALFSRDDDEVLGAATIREAGSNGAALGNCN
ncbi:MAG: tRNA 2-thiouridine(34) synthase MnmA [Candidatus Eremiobacteraeota bacterium]|nr:tRNA 2-thiouridine(34) synthase MnmA [Candidatus Eremiobacteraeota bacterium]